MGYVTDKLDTCGLKTIKFLVFIFNFVFWAFGLIMFITGIVILCSTDSYIIDVLSTAGVSTSTINTACALLIVIGIIIFGVGFCGCCGAIRESKLLLIVYLAFLLFIFVLEITTACVSLVYREDLMTEIEAVMNETIAEEYGSNSVLTTYWDLLQENDNCCGVSGPSDWTDTEWKINVTRQGEGYLEVPKSCCKVTDDAPQCQLDSTNSNSVYQQGCLEVIEDWFWDNAGVLAGVTITVAILQIVGMVFSLILIRAINQQSE